MSKVDKDTRDELRRLAGLPGHDRLGMIAKGCIVELLNELDANESFKQGVQNGSTEVVSLSVDAIKELKEEIKPFKDGLEEGVKLGVEAGLKAPMTETGRWFKKSKAEPVEED